MKSNGGSRGALSLPDIPDEQDRPDWIPVTTRLPETVLGYSASEAVQVKSEATGQHGIAYHGDTGWTDQFLLPIGWEPTHWK